LYDIKYISKMADYNPLLIVCLVIVMVLMFVVMGYSAQAASKAQNNKNCLASGCEENQCQKDCHKNSTISAIVGGVAAGILLIGIIIYFVYYGKRMSVDAGNLASQKLQQFGGNMQQFGQQIGANVQQYGQ
jgi:hypothetical protein